MTPNDNLNAGIPEAGAAPEDEAIVKAGGANDPTTLPEVPATPEVLSAETQRLAEAIRTRAMSEATAAGDLARDAYQRSAAGAPKRRAQQVG